MKRLPQILPDPVMDKFTVGSIWRYKRGQLYVVVQVEGARVRCSPVQPDGRTRTPMKPDRLLSAGKLYYTQSTSKG